MKLVYLEENKETSACLSNENPKKGFYVNMDKKYVIDNKTFGN